MIVRCSLLAVILLGVVSPALAGEVPKWPYERLMREADVVVVATPTATRAIHFDFSKSRELGLDPEDPLGRQLLAQLGALRTTFRVIGTLRGARRETIDVVHFYWKEQNQVENGPDFIDFTEPQETAVDPGHGDQGDPQLMLFLRQSRHGYGIFEPVSGQCYPRLSVRRLTEPRFAEPARRPAPIEPPNPTARSEADSKRDNEAAAQRRADFIRKATGRGARSFDKGGSGVESNPRDASPENDSSKARPRDDSGTPSDQENEEDSGLIGDVRIEFMPVPRGQTTLEQAFGARGELRAVYIPELQIVVIRGSNKALNSLSDYDKARLAILLREYNANYISNGEATTDEKRRTDFYQRLLGREETPEEETPEEESQEEETPEEESPEDESAGVRKKGND